MTAWYVVNAHKTARGNTQPSASAPVTAATVSSKAVPIDIRNLGAIQANDGVTNRRHVGGQVMRVPFKQGRNVKVGDRLFQIDPRPFQAALDAAQADKQNDQAQQAGAETDLARYAKLVNPGYRTRHAYGDVKVTVAELQGAAKADEVQIETAQLNLNYAAAALSPRMLRLMKSECSIAVQSGEAI